MFKCPCRRQHRHRRGGDLQRELGVGVALAARGAQQSADHRGDIAPKIEDHGKHGADVNGDVHGQTLIGPAGQHRHQRQMAGGTDRQKLGQALDNGENDDLCKAHG